MLLAAAIPRVRTGEQLDDAYAVQHGTVAANGGHEKLRFRTAAKQLERYAFPTLADLEAEDTED